MIGKMAMLSEDDTTEPDGLEVIVSVRETDIDKFQSEAYNLFRYWRLRPKFEGHIPEFPPEKSVFEGKDGSWLIPLKPEGSYRFETPVAIMGNVAYTLSDSGLDWGGYDMSLRNLFNVGVRLFMDMGQIEVSASRESLQYTSQTQQAILNKLVVIRDELLDSISDQFSGCTSMYQAKVLFVKIFDLTSPLFPLKDLFNQHTTFNGKEVTSGHWDGQNEETMGAIVRRFLPASGRRSRAYSEPLFRVGANESIPIILNDFDSEKALLGRMAPLVEMENNAWGSKCKEALLITVKDPVTWTQWKAEKSFDAPMWKLSSLPKLKMKDIYLSNTNRTYYASHSKYTSKVFRWDDTDGKFRDKKTYWEALDIDYKEDEGVYVEMYKFDYRFNEIGFVHPSYLSDLCALVEKAGIEWPEIIGVKSSKLAIEKPPKMESLNSYLKRMVADKLDKLKLEHEMADRKTVEAFSTTHTMSEGLISNIGSIASHSDIIANFVAHYREMQHLAIATQTTALEKLADKFHVTIKRNGYVSPHDLNAEFGLIRKTYPMIFAVDLSRYSTQWPRLEPHILQYISLVNRSISKGKNLIPDVTDGDGI
jgi:hypothetical protein